MKKLRLYLKFYFERKASDLRSEARESAHSNEYFKKHPKTPEAFGAYVEGYISAYRHVYAKHKIEIHSKERGQIG